MTTNHFAIDNEVIGIEPDEKMLQDRFTENVKNKKHWLVSYKK